TSGAVWLGPVGSDLRLIGAHNIPESLLESWRLIPADSAQPAAVVLRSSEPLWIEREEPLREAALLGPFAAVPLGIGGARRGVVAFSYQSPRQFSDDDRRFILTLAHQCEQ